jgi:hypothetical protein
MFAKEYDALLQICGNRWNTKIINTVMKHVNVHGIQSESEWKKKQAHT